VQARIVRMVDWRRHFEARFPALSSMNQQLDLPHIRFTQRVVNSYVHERLAILASIKDGRSGRNWATRFTYEWFTNLGVYRLTGTVRHGTAHAQR
jgi:hypothetical protein